MTQKNKKIECVILDWAGTSVDFGCFAPVNAFIKAFEEISISISTTEVRIPMGMAKIEHVRQLLRMERINNEFLKTHGRDWTEEDVVNLNHSFEKYLFATLTDYTTPIPHVIETADLLRKNGLKIGSTTGYTRAMMNVVEPSARSKGYFPDNCITPDGFPKGRPAPFMIYQNMIDLNIQDTDCIVKVGDTIEDIREGLNAKVWSIGVIIGSNELGLTEADISNLPKEELQEKMTNVRNKMTEAGAHYVINTIDELPKIIEQINSKFNNS